MSTVGLVVVLAGGPSSEREVSLWTAESITDSLNRQDIAHQVVDPRSSDWLTHLKSLNPAVTFLALHGTFGEDGTIQKVLEENGIVFTGSGAKVSATTFDKIATKAIVKELGLATPDWQVANNDLPLTIASPVVVKPAREGSSFGVTIAWKEQDIAPAVTVAQKYDQNVLIEKYIAGTEVTCGVLDVFGQLQALPLVEIRPETEFFDFKAKYDARFCHEICPAEINPSLAKQIQEQSTKIFMRLGCSQYARLDWIIQNGVPYFLEINTLPGMTKTSLITKELQTEGINFDAFIAALIATAPKNRHNENEKR